MWTMFPMVWFKKGWKTKKLNFSPNIINGVSVPITICKLNKVYEMSVWWMNVWHDSVQPLDDKKKNVQNWLKSSIKGSLVHHLYN